MSEDGTIKREALAELLPSGDGRTLEVRIVPYNTVCRVSDDGGRTHYDEEWLPGAFDHQMSAAHRVLANFEHQRGIQGMIGKGTELRETADGLEGTFRMLDHSDADKALELVNGGSLTGVSVEAVPMKTTRKDGVVQRAKARLVNIALCREPAYPEAQVLAVREAVAEEDEAPAEDEQAEPEAPAEEEEATGELGPDPEMAIECSSDVELALSRIGYEPLITRAVTTKPWNGAASRFTDEQYKRSCLIDRGGDAPVKERCSLPVLEPDGTVNANALGAAAARINQVTGVGPGVKSAAARKLIRYYGQAKMEAPAALRALAAR